MDLSKIKKIYMIGIKGVGMTMLAQYMKHQGFEIVGSDTEEVFMTDQVLKKEKIKFYEGFSKENIHKDFDLVIYSTAYNRDTNIEVKYAEDSKLKMLSYAEALSVFFNQAHGIAVVGSHGKTTTSAWLSFVFDRAGKSPSAMIGSFVPQLEGASISGKSDCLIIEADEYQNKLKHYQPKTILLNNIDYDHPDYFKTREDYSQVFVDFISKLHKDDMLVANLDDHNVRRIVYVNTIGKVVTYGINQPADYLAYDIKQEGGKQFFKVKLGVDGDDDGMPAYNFLGEFVISLTGRHNVYNALAVIATCVEYEIGLYDVRTYLEDFTGTARRMEFMGEFRGAKIYDDYAHHPTEIKTTLEGVRAQYPREKIIVVFHPHTFTRTKALLNEFSESFDTSDKVIVLDVYGSAREEQGGGHSKDLIKKFENRKQTNKDKIIERDFEYIYIPTLVEVEDYLRENLERGEIVVLMGAGDVFRVGERLIKQ